MKKGLLIVILLISVLIISSCYYTPLVKLNSIRVFDNNGNSGILDRGLCL